MTGALSRVRLETPCWLDCAAFAAAPADAPGRQAGGPRPRSSAGRGAPSPLAPGGGGGPSRRGGRGEARTQAVPQHGDRPMPPRVRAYRLQLRGGAQPRVCAAAANSLSLVPSDSRGGEGGSRTRAVAGEVPAQRTHRARRRGSGPSFRARPSRSLPTAASQSPLRPSHTPAAAAHLAARRRQRDPRRGGAAGRLAFRRALHGQPRARLPGRRDRSRGGRAGPTCGGSALPVHRAPRGGGTHRVRPGWSTGVTRTLAGGLRCSARRARPTISAGSPSWRRSRGRPVRRPCGGPSPHLYACIPPLQRVAGCSACSRHRRRRRTGGWNAGTGSRRSPPPPTRALARAFVGCVAACRTLSGGPVLLLPAWGDTARPGPAAARSHRGRRMCARIGAAAEPLRR